MTKTTRSRIGKLTALDDIVPHSGADLNPTNVHTPDLTDSGSRLTTGRPALGLDLNPRDSRQHLPDDVDGGLSLDVSAKPIQPTPRSRQENKSPAPK
eukprot:3120338-Rhodomonas_salina.1